MKKSELKEIIKQTLKEAQPTDRNLNGYPDERDPFLSKAIKYYWMLVEPVDNDGMGLSHEDALNQMISDLTEHIEENK